MYVFHFMYVIQEICLISKGGGGGEGGSSLGQTLIKIKHNREMPGKICTI